MSKRVIKKISEQDASTSEPVESRIFMNGGSQAVRIPARWRFDSDEVLITWNDELGGLVIRPGDKEAAKAAFIAAIRALTDEEREEIRRTFTIERDQTPWRPNPELVKILGSKE